MPEIFGTKLLCCVRSISPEKITRSPGIRVKTARSERRIALISTMPRSLPIWYCMKTMANRPEIVVRDEDRISGMDLERETMAASLGS